MKIRSLILSSVLAVAFAVPAMAQPDEIEGHLEVRNAQTAGR
jgi:hypothetical protein